VSRMAFVLRDATKDTSRLVVIIAASWSDAYDKLARARGRVRWTKRERALFDEVAVNPVEAGVVLDVEVAP
jgi:hypothetical protein